MDFPVYSDMTTILNASVYAVHDLSLPSSISGLSCQNLIVKHTLGQTLGKRQRTPGFDEMTL